MQVDRRDILALALSWATFRFFTLVPVSAAGPQTAEDEPVHFRRQARQIEDYLNNIRTTRARFRQVSSTGEVADGYLYIQRPGRIRVEYDPPCPILIILDGLFIIYYDRQLEQVSHLPLSSTPASVLARDKIDLWDGDVMIAGLEQYKDTLRLTLVLRSDPRAGSITLVFNSNPVHLMMWSITDAQGVVTDVSLTQADFNLQLEEDLFQFQK